MISKVFDNTDIIAMLEEKMLLLSELKENELVYEPFVKDFKVRFCWSSNEIEGNTLNLEETLNLIEYDEVSSGHTFEECVDAKNLYKAVDRKLDWDTIYTSERWMKECNGYILGSNDPSEYRRLNVYVGSLADSVYYPVNYEIVSQKLKELLVNTDMNKKSITDIVREVALFHIQFWRIYPFERGNGHTGRLIMNQQLINYGLLPIAISKSPRYRNAFNAYVMQKNLSVMENIIFTAELEAVKRARKLIGKYKKGRRIPRKV